MEVAGQVVIVTGGARGIGKALCEMAVREGAAGVVVSDIDGDAAAATAAQLSAHANVCDVSSEASVQALVAETIARFGRVDLVISNAGITAKGGADTPDADWNRLWQVNVMGHVYLSRATLPGMLERSRGGFLFTSSAAGILTEIGSAAYSVTKHGTVAFAEWLSVHYRKQGIHVSCLCPAGVATDFLDMDDPIHQFLHLSSLTPDDVAAASLTALREEKFLVLPHPEVLEFFRFKAENYDRWLHNFAHVNDRLQKRRAAAERKRPKATDAE